MTLFLKNIRLDEDFIDSILIESLLLVVLVFLIVLFIINKFRSTQLLKKVQAEKYLLEKKFGQTLKEIKEKESVLEEQNKELDQKKEDDRIRRWFSEGVLKFTALLRQNDDDIDKMTTSIIKELVKYTGMEAGGFWVMDRNEDEEDFLELKGIAGFDGSKISQKVKKLKEDLVGSCAYDKKKIFVKDIPGDYLKIGSGLGEHKAQSLLLVPLVFNDGVYGVIELASLKVMNDHVIEFVEELGDKIAYFINATRVTEKTSRLLEKTESQAQELKTSEEELRQSLEEVHASQEQMTKREASLLSEIDDLKEKATKLEANLDKKNKEIESASGNSVKQKTKKRK